MFVSEIKDALDFMFKARVVPFFWGVHGIGKTTGIQEYAEKGAHKLFTLALGNVEIPDILGIMDPQVDSKGRKVASTYLIPEPLKELIDFGHANPDKYAILFLDELNHARKDVLSPVFQMITSNSLHTVKFPDNFRIVAASNPPTDDYPGVLNLRNLALLDRFCHIKVESSSQSWLQYVSGRVDNDIYGYIAANTEALRDTGAAFSVDQLCTPSERTWMAVDRLYKLGAPKEIIYGLVGTARGVAFYSWLENEKAKQISGDDILVFSKETEARVKKLIDGGKWAEVQRCVDNLQAKVALITSDLHALYEKGDPAGSVNNGFCTDDESNAIARFLLMLPDEIYLSAAHTLMSHTCRYIGYKVYDRDDIAARIKDVLERTKKAEEASAPAPAKKKGKKA